MEKKKYSSYAEIDRDLEILKIEKDIEYQKLLMGIQQTRDSFTPQNMIRGVLNSWKEEFSWKDLLANSYGSLLNRFIPQIFNWFINRKRGD
ncbi:MAG TPA: DUF6327 family protein [Flavobacterium sp.]|nr:DUF6327 family protein [Flavobacterium sp.]